MSFSGSMVMKSESTAPVRAEPVDPAWAMDCRSIGQMSEAEREAGAHQQGGAEVRALGAASGFAADQAPKGLPIGSSSSTSPRPSTLGG